MKKSIIVFAIASVFLIFSVGLIETASPLLVKTKNNLNREEKEKPQRILVNRIDEIKNNGNFQKIIEIFEKNSDNDPQTLGLKLFLEYMKLAVLTAIGGAFVLLVGCIVLPLLPVGMFMIGAAGVFAIMGVLALFVPD
jgi:hypothetical protein